MVDFFGGLQVWHWLILGLLLLSSEILGAGGFLIGAGAAAFLQVLLLLVAPDVSWQYQLTLFAFNAVIMTIIYWKFLRNYNQKTDNPAINDRATQLIGRVVVIEEDINSTQHRLQIGDTFWRVQLDAPMTAGSSAKVVGADGMVLKLESVAS